MAGTKSWQTNSSSLHLKVIYVMSRKTAFMRICSSLWWASTALLDKEEAGTSPSSLGGKKQSPNLKKQVKRSPWDRQHHWTGHNRNTGSKKTWNVSKKNQLQMSAEILVDNCGCMCCTLGSRLFVCLFCSPGNEKNLEVTYPWWVWSVTSFD